MRESGSEPFDAIEAALSTRLRRWSEHGVVAIDAADIAHTAATTPTRGVVKRVPNWSRFGSRRSILGLAALLLLPLGLILAGAYVQLRPDQADAYRAVVVRPSEDGVDVVLADADGGERVLRHVTPEGLGLDPRYVLAPGGSVSEKGWLQLSAAASGDDRAGLERYGVQVLIDLADPTSAPIILPASGFMSGRWGPDGQYALFCTDSTEPPNCGQPMGSQPHMDAGAVRVLEPDRGLGSEIIVPEVQTFGGGPQFFWTADGSGFLARRGTEHGEEWGVTPLDGGAFIPGAPRLLSREMDVSGSGLAALTNESGPGPATYDEWLGDIFGAATPQAAQLSFDRTAVWQLLDASDQGPPRALLARLTGPRQVESVRTFELPAGAVPGFFLTLSADDTYVAIDLSGEDHERFVLAPMGSEDQTIPAGPVIDGWLAGLVPAASADGWPGG